MTHYRRIAGLAIALIGAGSIAHAAGTGNDAFAINNARVSLSQAVASAESHVGGKAARAEYENTDEGAAYDVEVVKGVQVFDVRVNAENGSVIQSREDSLDDDDESDHVD